MQKIITTLISCLLAFHSISQISTPPNGDNQRTVTRQYIGSVAWVEVDYHSPDVTSPRGESREGKIWGQLVPYGFAPLGFGESNADNPSPWRAGANENTTFEFSHDVLIDGKKLGAGKYGFFVAPAESGPWTIIFSKDNNHWGSYFYKEENDVLRVEVEAKESPYHEWLTYAFIDRQPTKTTAAMLWENKMLPFSIEVDNFNEVVLSQIESELKNGDGFTYNSHVSASNYASQLGDHERAIKWANSAINDPFFGQKNFSTLQAKGNALAAAGKKEEAKKIMNEAIKHPTATSLGVYRYGNGLIRQGEKEEALEVLKYGHKKFEGAWPTNLGLAQAYSAKGDYKTALKYANNALKNAPNEPNKAFVQGNIDKLKKGESIN
ncbi:MAG: DUF2911 domain-containing protein [Bacteroidota bacterium]